MQNTTGRTVPYIPDETETSRARLGDSSGIKDAVQAEHGHVD